ncbi:MAG: CDP-alcohol phosphatidyltransferase family protein [Patescibacteria group bacterium]
MNLSYFQKKNSAVREPESLEWRTLPNLFTLGRFFLVIPLGWAMVQRWTIVFFIGIALYVLLDCFDGHWARIRGEQTRVGRLLDSACDKITAMGLFGVAIWLALFPLWVVAPILLCCVVQFGMAGWAWVCGRHRSGRLPTTYLLSLMGAALVVGFFSPSPVRVFVYGFAVLASVNHVFYYGWLLFSELQRRIIRAHLRKSLGRLAWIRERWNHGKEGLRGAVGLWTFPNAITFGRAFLIIPAVFAIEQGSWAWFLWAVTFVALDLADGILARKLRQTSEVGRVLDIVVDKLFFIVLGVTWWRLGIIGNDLAILFAVRVMVVAVTGIFAERILHVSRPVAFWSAPSNIALVLFVLSPNPFWEIAAIGFALQLILHYPYQLLIQFLCRPPSTL